MIFSITALGSTGCGLEAEPMRLGPIKWVWTALTLLVFAASCQASIIAPSGLNIGDHYRIIFVTSTTGAASSPDISDYNTFVSTAANAGDLAALGATWVVVGSTVLVDADTNIGTFTSPIYNTGGLLVATGSAGLWSGTLSNGVGFDENGNVLADAADTGTSSGGTGASGLQFGSSGGFVLDGSTTATTSVWVANGILPQAYAGRHFYGISSDLIFTGSEAVPEPGSMALLLLGAVGLGGLARRRVKSVI
jgi:hypothetical protein